MRVAHIVGSLEARYGGPSRSVRRLAFTTAELGHDVDILTSAPKSEPVEDFGRFHVHTWRRAWPSAICRVPGMAQHLSATSYDIVHHHGLWLRTLHYAQRNAARDRVPLIVSPRGMMSRWAWRLHRLQKIFAARCVHPGALAAVDGWHATSTSEADDIRRQGFLQPICVAPNGVDQPRDQDIAFAREHWLMRVPAARTNRVALFYSRFHSKKRIIELIDLWRKLAPPDWLLLLIGVPEQYSVPQLEARASRAGPKAKIEVYDGAGQPPPYAIASLFLLPSHSENFGLVIAEAAAFGVPAVVTDTTPWQSLPQMGLGWCVPWPEYRTTLSAALAERPAALQARGAAARTWILREYSWVKATEELVTFYSTIKAARS